MALSVYNYTILDRLAEYLRSIRSAVQEDQGYRYVCVMERRCFNLVAHFLPDLLDRVVTSNGLLCMGRDIARYYRENDSFPRMLVCDDIVIHGRNLARFFYTLEEEVVEVLKESGIEFTFEQRRILHRKLIEAVDIYAHVRSKHPLLLEYDYIQKMQYERSCSDAEIRDISLQITDFLNRSGETNTSFVLSFPKSVLKSQARVNRGDWKRCVRDLTRRGHNVNENAPNEKMIAYVRGGQKDRPQNRISTVRYYSREARNQWITSVAIFGDCSGEHLEGICRLIGSSLKGDFYKRIRSILNEETSQLQEVRWQLVNFFASAADFFDFYEAYEGTALDEAAQKKLMEQSNWKKISANFRGIRRNLDGEQLDPLDPRIGEELYQFCCNRELLKAVQHALDEKLEPLKSWPFSGVTDSGERIDAAARQIAAVLGMKQEKAAYDLEERPYSFDPKEHTGGAIPLFFFLKEMTKQGKDCDGASFPMEEGVVTILELLDGGVVSLRLHQDVETKALQTVLKVGELATFYWPVLFSVYVPALAFLEGSCWRQNMKPREAVQRFLRERAFVSGDPLPAHLTRYTLEDVQQHLLDLSQELYDCGQSYRGWDFENLEQRRDREVQEEGIRSTVLKRAKEFLYLS